MNELYEIVRRDFGNLENEIDSAITETSLGVTTDMSNEEVDKILIQLDNNPTNIKYNGWDGEVYPKYYARKLKMFNKNIEEV